MRSKEKYIAFRNFMVNELGITRQDIEAWTKESVATEVGKILGQFDVEGKAELAVKSEIRAAVQGSNFGWRSSPSELQTAIAKELGKKLIVRVEHAEE